MQHVISEDFMKLGFARFSIFLGRCMLMLFAYDIFEFDIIYINDTNMIKKIHGNVEKMSL
jgi:hypothetical protein